MTGKPGAGKSTLMKYIRHEPKATTTFEHLGWPEEAESAAFLLLELLISYPDVSRRHVTHSDIRGSEAGRLNHTPGLPEQT